MKELLAGLEIVAAQEKKRAEKEHGATFRSTHEAYGVIAEELMEANQEMSQLSGGIMTLLRVVHRDNPDLYRHTLGDFRQAALEAAAELVQVVAMCDKAVASLDVPPPVPIPVDPDKRRKYEVYTRGDWGAEK